VEIPPDPVAAIKALTVNLSKMDGYIRQLEMFLENVKSFYELASSD